jgi:hypothetical protein
MCIRDEIIGGAMVGMGAEDPRSREKAGEAYLA